MDERQQEYQMLVDMDDYERRAYLIQSDLTYWRWRFDYIQHRLKQAHNFEEWCIRMGKKYLSHYNDYNLEEDWQASQEYLGLAKDTQEEQQYLRSTVAEITDNVKRYKKEWEQAKKMMELQQKLMQKPQKN